MAYTELCKRGEAAECNKRFVFSYMKMLVEVREGERMEEKEGTWLEQEGREGGERMDW